MKIGNSYHLILMMVKSYYYGLKYFIPVTITVVGTIYNRGYNLT